MFGLFELCFWGFYLHIFLCFCYFLFWRGGLVAHVFVILLGLYLEKLIGLFGFQFVVLCFSDVWFVVFKCMRDVLFAWILMVIWGF